MSAFAESGVRAQDSTAAARENSSLRAQLSLGPALDLRGDPGGLLLLRVGHNFAFDRDTGLVLSGELSPMVIPSANDAHNRACMVVSANLGFSVQLGVRWMISVSGGTAIGATQALKLSAGPFVSGQLESFFPLNDSSEFLVGAGLAWIRSAFDGTDSATIASLRVGLAWSR